MITLSVVALGSAAAVMAVEAGAPLEAVRAATGSSAVALSWLIPVVPAVSAGLLLLFGKRLGGLAAVLAVLAAGFAAVASTLVFAELLGQPAGERTFVVDLGTWLAVGELDVAWSLLVDPLSAVMLLLVTWVGLLIHVYSLGYMHGDPRYSRFFAYLNLFVASMLVLVLGESFLVTFVGWELVGLCSYLLIGFWFEKPAYAAAAKKAFVLNRVGDVGFMLAMFVVFGAFGTLSYTEVLPQAATTLTAGAALAVGLLLFLGATGKSAQIPLFVWLPDAMAGPTPVSALIHAATMVTAGVYLIARTSPIYALVPDVGLVVACVGVATAFVAAAIACAQNDLKRILAYSTVSQLGYMFVGVGLGDYTAGVFHLLTHGFFKALLFLAAGSVMHALADQTDVRLMGGLWRVMPVTFATSVVAVLAISGIPFFSGYFSKEEILAAAAYTPGAGPVIWGVGIVVAVMTAFYMWRWLHLVFLGPARWPDGAHPHESPLSMTLPLGVLGVASLAGGVVNLNPETGFLHGWLGQSVVQFERVTAFAPTPVYVGAAIAAGVVGIAGAFLAYRRVDVATIGVAGGMSRAARDRFYVDEAYERAVFAPLRLVAVGFAWFDRVGIDGAVNGSAGLTRGLANVGRRVQTGFVRSYALGVLLGTVLVTAILLSSYVMVVVS